MWKLTELEMIDLGHVLAMLSLAKWSLDMALPSDLRVTLQVLPSR